MTAAKIDDRITRENIWDKLPLLKRSALFYLEQGMSSFTVAERIEDSKPSEINKTDFEKAIHDLWRTEDANPD